MFWVFLYYLFGVAVLWGMCHLTVTKRRALLQRQVQLKELQTHMIHLEIEMMEFIETTLAGEEELGLETLEKMKQSVKLFAKHLQYNRRCFGVEREI